MIYENGLRKRTTRAEWEAGEKLAAQGLLRELRNIPGLVEYMVTDEPYVLVRLHADEPAKCDCGQEGCRHLVAAYLQAENSGALNDLEYYHERYVSEAFYEAVESIIPQTPMLTLEPSLFFDQQGISVSLRAGEERLYVVRSIPRFLYAIEHLEEVELSSGHSIKPQLSDFTPHEASFLRILLSHTQALEQGDAKLSAQQARKLPLKGEIALRVLQGLEKLRFRVTFEKVTRLQEGIDEMLLPAVFYVSGNRNGLSIRAHLDSPCELVGKDGSFMMMDNQLIRLLPEDRALARVVLPQEDKLFSFPRGDIARVTGELLPTLMRSHAVILDEKLERRMIRRPLSSRVYLDQQGSTIQAKVRFVYGDIELDPFSAEKEGSRLLLHDAIGERKVLEALAESGFRVQKGFVYLSGDEPIYRFLTDGVQDLGRKAELFLSQDFKRLKPRTPTLSGRLSGTASQLQLSVLDDGTPMEELVPLLQAIRSRKQYFRYKNGSFITLQNTESWQEFADAALEAVKDHSELRNLKGYRAAYLKALIEEAQLPVDIAPETAQLASIEQSDIKSPVAGLHGYQVRGFHWIYSLYQLGMGGVLADEMGLGKTVQTIAAILYAVQHEKEKMPSIIVVPTTLTYNWLSEFQRFSPKLRIQIISGPRPRREELITQFLSDKAPDVMIISYPLIRQDIDLLKDISFRFAVLDEAQHIKNALSLSAKAVKRLQAKTRLALSGTPMENNVAELWSLFDFVMPGYLPNIRDFVRRYDQGKNAPDLLRRIRPFLMRRLKKEVMAELPDKVESVITIPMTPEQRKIYLAVLHQKRMRMEGLIEHNALTAGRAEVLAALTELRQICCHPSLIMQGYGGEAGKIKLLEDMLPQAMEEGHRVLIFSQFTQMLKILRRWLYQEGIEALYLDGDTKPEERLQLADRFNKGTEPVFLISLKAGGTGLNLTGADMVIHFDPWWNPSAEDQAADRAHRLGQTRNVHVMRLVMHDSIEEQVLALGRGKRKLFEQLITPGEQMPQKLSQQDVLRLFSVSTKEEELAEAEAEQAEQ
ncbi:MAG: DEAD/DEAH box helicase family protein [Clostridiales bacterium]|nr:DEAD/DEAH box helicase family protein [Clostridiales bacterium]